MFKNYNLRKRKINKKKKIVKNDPHNFGKPINSSKLETFFEDFVLKPLGIKYQAQKKLSTKFYDFYIPSHKLLIEVDGDYYHAKDRTKDLNEMQVKSIMNDHKKNMIAKNKGYSIIRFWESDINKKTLTVKKELQEELEKIENNNN